MGLIHCTICLVLDKCWFNNVLKPQLPQYERCRYIANDMSKSISNIDSKAKCDNWHYFII